MDSNKKCHLLTLAVIALIGITLGIVIGVIGTFKTKDSPVNKDCESVDKYLDESNSFSFTISTLDIWNRKYWFSNNLIYIGARCPSSLFFMEFELIINDKTLIAKSEATDRLGWYRLIKDCHNNPLVKIERFNFGKSLEGPLAKYTAWWQIINVSTGEFYAYVVTEGKFNNEWRIVDNVGKILVKKDFTSLIVKTVTFLDTTNPASDPRIAAVLSGIMTNSSKDNCNEAYYGCMITMAILFCAFALYLGWIIYRWLIKKDKETIHTHQDIKTHSLAST
jgi:hypothetical protein